MNTPKKPLQGSPMTIPLPGRSYSRAPGTAPVSPATPVDVRQSVGNGAVKPKKLPLGARAAKPADGPLITLTQLNKDGGPLTKQYALAPDGSLVKDHSACVLFAGTAERITVAGVAGLGALIETLTSSQALALGTLRADLPNRVTITTEQMLRDNRAPPDSVARTKSNIMHRQGGTTFVLLDYDTKGMPDSVKAELQRHGGFWPALLSVLPALSNVARLTRSSTSAGLSRADTGEAIPGSDGVHIFIEVMDGADSERFLRALHNRCWLAGMGWIMVSSSGALLERSIVDRMVGGAERLVFEGGPVLALPLLQDRECRRPVVNAGVTLDTLAACPPISIVEKARLEEIKSRERDRVAPEEAKAQTAFTERKTREMVKKTGMPEAAAKAAVLRMCEGILRPDIELPFDDEALAGCTVGDVLADPERFEGETLADPLEGVEYGRCVAKIMRRPDGTPWIHSFAHGRTIYHLRHDVSSVRKILEAVKKEEVATQFAALAAAADLNAAEIEELRQTAKVRSGVGLSVLRAMLKTAQQQQAIAAAQAKRSFLAARRNDPRLRIPSPLFDAPWLPQIDVLNEVIGAVTTALLPPSRDIDDDLMWVRKTAIPGTHAFTDANPEGEDE